MKTQMSLNGLQNSTRERSPIQLSGECEMIFTLQGRTGSKLKTRRKLLPSLPANYDSGKYLAIYQIGVIPWSANAFISPIGAGPRDNPALHQGRSRSRPFVVGEYNAHIYVNRESSSSIIALVLGVEQPTDSRTDASTGPCEPPKHSGKISRSRSKASTGPYPPFPPHDPYSLTDPRRAACLSNPPIAAQTRAGRYFQSGDCGCD